MFKKVLGLITALALLASPVFVGAQQKAPQAGEKAAPQAAEKVEKKEEVKKVKKIKKKAKKAKAVKKEEKKEVVPEKKQ